MVFSILYLESVYSRGGDFVQCSMSVSFILLFCVAFKDAKLKDTNLYTALYADQY